MAISYYELARLRPSGEPIPVAQNATLIFDEIVSYAGAQISYNPSTGVINFNQAGFYYIDWYVAPQFGLTTDGSNWAIQTNLSQQSIIGSSHTHISATTGFAILNVEAGETAVLVNVSDGTLYLSQAVESKAGLVVYGITEPGT